MNRAACSIGIITLGEPTLERAVASVREHVKQVVIVYTGNDAKDALRAQSLADTFEWATQGPDEAAFDFAWARNRTLALATEPVYSWMDSDDTIIGAENISKICATLKHGERIMSPYLYWNDPDTGACTLNQPRERFVLNDGHFEWRKPVHEGLVAKDGVSTEIHNGWTTWKHHRTEGKTSHERNLKILRRYVEKRGADTWAHYQLAHALADLGEPEEAVEHFKAYLADSNRKDERALACMRLAQLLGGVGSIGNALHWIDEALKECPEHFDALLAKARLMLVRGITTGMGSKKDILESIQWAWRAVDSPKLTILPTNPTDRALAHETIAFAYEQLGDDAKVKAAAHEALKVQPNNPRLLLMADKHRKPAPGCLDIVIACGPTPEVWNPHRSAELGIGGSETAVIEMSRRLAAKGHRVRVYTTCGTEGLYDGVEYHDSAHMMELPEVDVLVAWRNAWYLELVPARVKLLWVHDAVVQRASPYRFSCADRVMALSNWHREWLLEMYGGKNGLREEQVTVTRNGIDPHRFDSLAAAGYPHMTAEQEVDWRKATRNARKAIYSSSADRGLEVLLDLWPRIRAEVPDAELHVFYGRVAWLPPEFVERVENKLAELADQGVVDRGRVNQRELAREMLSAGAWLYPSIHTLKEKHEPWHETFCLHPDSRISVPGDHRGGPPTVRIADMVGQSGFPVYAYDVSTNRFKIATCNRVWQSKVADELVAIDLDSGATLRVTPDHLVMTWDREWVEAATLKPGDRLLALHYRYNVAIQDGNGDWVNEHRLVGEWKERRALTRNDAVDHLDPIRLDNRPEMLQVLTMSQHSKKTHTGKTLTSTHRKRVGQATRAWAQANIEQVTERNSRAGSALWAWLRSLPEEERDAWLKARAAKSGATQRERAATDPEFHQRLVEKAAKGMQKIRQMALDDPDMYKRASQKGRAVLAELEAADPERKRRRYEKAGQRSIEVCAQKREEKRAKNHKVVAVRRIAGGPVFDMEVEGLHNFVAEGIVVHNCIGAVEAAAAGLHIVCGDWGGLHETARGVRLGGDFNTDEWRDAFVKHSAHALTRTDDEVRAKVASIVRKKYDWQGVADEWSQLLTELVGGEKAAE